MLSLSGQQRRTLLQSLMMRRIRLVLTVSRLLLSLADSMSLSLIYTPYGHRRMQTVCTNSCNGYKRSIARFNEQLRGLPRRPYAQSTFRSEVRRMIANTHLFWTRSWKIQISIRQGVNLEGLDLAERALAARCASSYRNTTDVSPVKGSASTPRRKSRRRASLTIRVDSWCRALRR